MPCVLLALQLLFGLVTQCHLFPIVEREREHRMTRPNNGFERDYIYYCSCNREKINIICLLLVALKNIFPHNFTLKNKLKLYCISIRTQAKANCDLKWVKKRIIFQRRFLVWSLICRLFTRNWHVIGLSPR